MAEGAARTVLLGVGNPLMRDDGFGLVVLERLRAEWSFDDSVELVDGGTWGMNLLPVLEDAQAVVFIDAIKAGVAPGTPLVLEREQLPMFLAGKLSPHEIGLRDVITLAEIRGRLPERLVAIGVEPQDVAVGIGLSPAVDGRIEAVAHAVISRLRVWGHACEPQVVHA